MTYKGLMSFELIADLTRWTARLSMLIFAFAFIYDGLRRANFGARNLWRGFFIVHMCHMFCVICYFIIANEAPTLDPLTSILSIALLMVFWIGMQSFTKAPKSDKIFASHLAAWTIALIFTATPISRILPAETNHPIYHIMLYGMLGVLGVRIVLDIKAGISRRAAATS